MGEDQQPHVQQEGAPAAAADAATPAQTPRWITCPRCGAWLPDTANFCLHCGLPLRGPPVPRTARVYAIANQKRRVGKTITAINLAACLAEAGRRVLLVDMSPGAEATTGLGLDAHHVGLYMYELLVDDHVTAREVSEHFPKEKFRTLIPRNVRLAEAPGYGQTILEHEPRSPGALAYKELAEEVIERAAVIQSCIRHAP